MPRLKPPYPTYNSWSIIYGDVDDDNSHFAVFTNGRFFCLGLRTSESMICDRWHFHRISEHDLSEALDAMFAYQLEKDYDSCRR